MRRGYEFGAFDHFDRGGELISELPVEIVTRHVQYDFLPAVGVFEPVGHILSADMHMRTEPDQYRILFERGLRRRAFPVWIVWRNGEAIGIRRSRDGIADVTIFGFFFRQHEADLRMVDNFV